MFLNKKTSASMLTKFASIAFAALVGLSLTVSSASADHARGQKLYLKFMKDATGIKGDAFAAQHTIAEWKNLCSNEGAGFIDEYSKKYPNAADFLKGPQFKKFQPDICDFVIHYAKDSGNVPSC
ncbi:hypothetical protein [Campylobacter sp. RM16187]|uniref:hypothetical protein n=1 Tax=Campylobacter sp. RM16187 TaxID=1660063 RepID=UPI0021B515AE|nr:hypothetical protein [Campylobacter sp. RM16187]QKG29533.1 hypothetical protein CDOMF_1280 [Campylobacter sp. RM16187]